MILNYLYGFLSVIIVSAISLGGVFILSLKESFTRKYIFVFVSLAAGALLGDAFIHLIPEALDISINPTLTGLLIIFGILGFLILEKFFHWHHHGEDTNEPHKTHPVGKLVLFSDGVHNITDGMIIGSSFLVSVPVGIATTISVILHEIPQEIGDFAVLLHAGYSTKRALFLNLVSGLTALIGVIIAFVIGSMGDYFNLWIISIVAGGFIYIATADLIPEIHKTKEIKYSIIQVISFIVGVLLMLALLLFE